MTVELKKTKITTSIVNQSLLGNYSLFYNCEGYDMLGWCLIKAKKGYVRYNILYRRATNQIIKLPYILKDSHIELIKESVQRSDNNGGYIYPTVYKLKIHWYDFNNTQAIKEQFEETDEYMEELFKKVKGFRFITEQKGQIYL